MLTRSVTLFVASLLLSLSCFAASPQPVGILSSAGSNAVAIAGVTVPSGTALYKGDTIETSLGSAIFTLADAGSFIVSPNSKVRLTGAQSVEVLKGMSRVESRHGGLTVIASNWVLGPTPDTKSGRVSADIVVDDSGRVSVNVADGQLTARNPATKEVAVASLGRPVLLPSAAAPPAPQQTPSAPAAGPGGRSHARVVGAYVIGVSALAVGVAALATRDSGVSTSDFNTVAGQVAQLSSTNTALQAQVTKLQGTVTSLTASVNAANTFGTATQALLGQLQAALAALQVQEASLSSNQATINTLVAKIAAGGTLTAAEQTQLTTARNAVQTASTNIAAISAQISTISAAVSNLKPPPSVSPSKPAPVPY